MSSNAYTTLGLTETARSSEPRSSSSSDCRSRSTTPIEPSLNDYDVHTLLRVSLKQAYVGMDSVAVTFTRESNCQIFLSQQAETFMREICHTCHGSGRAKKLGPKTFIVCFDCHGTGVKDCHLCDGVEFTDISLPVALPQGIKNNELLVLRNQGNLKEDNITRGNVFIKVIVDESGSKFKRSGDDLFTNINLSLKDALLGIANRDDLLYQMDGRPIIMYHAPGTVISPDTIMTIKNEGMPTTEEKRGNLFVYFNIMFPTTVNIPASPEAKDVISSFFDENDENEAAYSDWLSEDEDEYFDAYSDIEYDNHANSVDSRTTMAAENHEERSDLESTLFDTEEVIVISESDPERDEGFSNANTLTETREGGQLHDVDDDFAIKLEAFLTALKEPFTEYDDSAVENRFEHQWDRWDQERDHRNQNEEEDLRMKERMREEQERLVYSRHERKRKSPDTSEEELPGFEKNKRGRYPPQFRSCQNN